MNYEHIIALIERDPDGLLAKVFLAALSGTASRTDLDPFMHQAVALALDASIAYAALLPDNPKP